MLKPQKSIVKVTKNPFSVSFQARVVVCTITNIRIRITLIRIPIHIIIRATHARRRATLAAAFNYQSLVDHDLLAEAQHSKLIMSKIKETLSLFS